MLSKRYDMPDDWQFMGGSVRYPVMDVGELAVRLGSPDFYDRRGEVVFMDNFNEGITKWGQLISGSNAAVYLSADKGFGSPYAAFLQAGSDTNKVSGLVRVFSSSLLGRCGLEVSLQFDSEFDYTQIIIIRSTGTTLMQGSIYLYRTDGEIKYIDDTGTQISIDTGHYFYELTDTWRLIKLVVDFDTGFYSHLLVDNLFYDLTDHELYNPAGAEPLYHSAAVNHFGRAAHNDTIYIGHCIITGNEP